MKIQLINKVTNSYNKSRKMNKKNQALEEHLVISSINPMDTIQN